MRIIALYRVSTEKQANEGASLDAQQRKYRELAEQRGWTTVAEFKGCESATKASSERRVLQQVLASVREHAPDGVYVHEQSRLTRGDELEVALLLRELRERGLKIIVGGVVRDLSSIDERFMISIQGLVDRAESERIKERMQRGKRERARQGRKASGPAPYGYMNPPPGAPGRGTLQVVPEEAIVVRKIFALTAAGESEREVQQTLAESGCRTSRGKLWGRSSIRRVLENPAYIGTAASNVWVDRTGRRSFQLDLDNENAIIVESAHEAIIDRETWDAVHGRPRTAPTRKPRMLTGLIYVGGLRFHGNSTHGRAFYRSERGVRGQPWLETESTDDAVWEAFISLASEPEFVSKLMEEAENPRERVLAQMEVEYLEDQIGRQERRLNNLIEMRADAEIDKATYLAKRDEANQVLGRLRAELREQRAKASAVDGSHAARVVKSVQTLLAGRTRLTVKQKKSVISSIVRRVDVEAEPTGALQKRGEGGRLSESGGARWKIASVGFKLAIPPEDAPDEQPCRSGHLVTTSSCWDRRVRASR